jgi:hypothetical protein
VTLRAIVIKVPRNVIRVRRLLELLLMALVAIIVYQLVVPVGMAGLTLRRNMSTGQREPCSVMIERCIVPIGC